MQTWQQLQKRREALTTQAAKRREAALAARQAALAARQAAVAEQQRRLREAQKREEELRKQREAQRRCGNTMSFVISCSCCGYVAVIVPWLSQAVLFAALHTTLAACKPRLFSPNSVMSSFTKYMSSFYGSVLHLKSQGAAAGVQRLAGRSGPRRRRRYRHRLRAAGRSRPPAGRRHRVYGRRHAAPAGGRRAGCNSSSSSGE